MGNILPAPIPSKLSFIMKYAIHTLYPSGSDNNFVLYSLVNRSLVHRKTNSFGGTVHVEDERP